MAAVTTYQDFQLVECPDAFLEWVTAVATRMRNQLGREMMHATFDVTRDAIRVQQGIISPYATIQAAVDTDTYRGLEDSMQALRMRFSLELNFGIRTRSPTFPELPRKGTLGIPVEMLKRVLVGARLDMMT